jgi:hypothetical protein
MKKKQTRFVEMPLYVQAIWQISGLIKHSAINLPWVYAPFVKCNAGSEQSARSVCLLMWRAEERLNALVAGTCRGGFTSTLGLCGASDTALAPRVNFIFTPRIANNSASALHHYWILFLLASRWSHYFQSGGNPVWYTIIIIFRGRKRMKTKTLKVHCVNLRHTSFRKIYVLRIRTCMNVCLRLHT